MEESQTLKNGRIYLKDKPSIILGISPGNPFFYKMENLVKMLGFSKNNSDHKVLLFLPDKISQHNYRAVGSSNPEKSARLKANRLRNKCKEAIRSCGIERAEFINWSHDVETSTSYTDAFNHVKHLYQVNNQFQKDVQESTQSALVSLKIGRDKNMLKSSENMTIDMAEGVKYVLKELAFLSVVSDIYEGCEKFVFVYHRPWSVLEKFFDGGYDKISRTSLGLYVLE